MNKVILMGRLTKDVELRYTTTNNMAVAQYSLAIDRRTKDSNGKYEADFIPIVAWGKSGEFASKYFKKGQQVAVVGHLQTRKYEDKDGKTVFVTEVVVEEQHFAGNNPNGNNQSNGQEQSFMKQEEFVPVTDDDLPF